MVTASRPVSSLIRFAALPVGGGEGRFQPHFIKQGQNAAHRRCFSGSGAACKHEHAAACRKLHRHALQPGVGDAALFFNIGNDFFTLTFRSAGRRPLL